MRWPIPGLPLAVQVATEGIMAEQIRAQFRTQPVELGFALAWGVLLLAFWVAT